MKSILIIDTPKDCGDCQLMVDGWCYGIPSREEVQGKIKYLKRPSWCPLKPLPEWKDVPEYLETNRDWEAWGYDLCLAEILGDAVGGTE